MSEHTFLFYGAGEAGVGIAELISSAIAIETGCTQDEARANVWLVDSHGLISSERTDKLAHHKLPYAHTPPASTQPADKRKR
jgi:malate dehydrogenase (oxaloacetate-decarboxylating)(NADP+)